MVKKGKCFENYPCWIVVISNLISVLIYALGAYIIYQLGLFYLIIYLVYIILLELRVMANSCVNCYYYGKCCAFGKGRLSAVLFKKGKKNNTKEFARMKISWKDIFPDFLVSFLPIITGIVLVIVDFSWLLLCLVVVLVILSSFGNGFIRGSLACRFCKQREIGCPAEKLFNKR
jgi:hypothetical protein